MRALRACVHRPISPRTSWALYASLAQGVYFTEKPVRLHHRIKDIEDGRYQSEWDRILSISELQKDICEELK